MENLLQLSSELGTHLGSHSGLSQKTPFLEFILHKVVFWFLENAFQFHSVFLPAQSDPDSARGHKWVKSDFGRMPLKVASISNITKNGSYENVIITRQ